MVVEELAERVGLVVEEGLLLRRQLGAVRVEQVLEARRTCGAMVRRKYGTPKAGTRTAYVQYGGPGTYVPTQALTVVFARSSAFSSMRVLSCSMRASSTFEMVLTSCGAGQGRGKGCTVVRGAARMPATTEGAYKLHPADTDACARCRGVRL